eukprot:TRINITY_DN53010_c0_g1_i1.p1 TRINITY_DN53010_c0_g1~~TRINITY_DN53010_c0_g1_i1.p1  ORF type:complete len:221 (+),score=88.33 TRINITY_DN53010_c0_g1_i1:87-749(+)
MAKKVLKKSKDKGSGEKKVGLLAGKVKGLLPEALDVAKLLKKDDADDDDDSDDAPEEVTTNRVAGGAEEAAAEEEPEEAENSEAPVAKKKIRRGTRGSKAKKEEKYVWQDPENQELFEALREQDENRRRKDTDGRRIDKDGITLVRDGVAQESLSTAPADFLTEELWNRRKRKRSQIDRFDRNVLGRGRAAGMHVVKPKKAAKPNIGKKVEPKKAAKTKR